VEQVDPEGSDVVVMLSGLEITMANIFVSVLLPLSVTFAVNVTVPAEVGVPDMTPVELFIINPASKVPVVMDHVYGALPLVALRGWVYAVPVTPSANALVVIVSGL
jgi:hypothetical protein